MNLATIRKLIIKVAKPFGLELREQWVIVDGGMCVPASQANPEQHPQPVSVAWIEESRRGWAKLSAQQHVPAELLPPIANDVEDDAWVKGTQIP